MAQVSQLYTVEFDVPAVSSAAAADPIWPALTLYLPNGSMLAALVHLRSHRSMPQLCTRCPAVVLSCNKQFIAVALERHHRLPNLS